MLKKHLTQSNGTVCHAPKVWIQPVFCLYILLSYCTNSLYSEPFVLHRGQGCPLSPVLFALAPEPVAIAICSSPNLVCGGLGVEHKVSLYADDLLLMPLPNFRFYYCAANIQSLSHWMHYHLYPDYPT